MVQRSKLSCCRYYALAKQLITLTALVIGAVCQVSVKFQPQGTLSLQKTAQLVRNKTLTQGYSHIWNITAISSNCSARSSTGDSLVDVQIWMQYNNTELESAAGHAKPRLDAILSRGATKQNAKVFKDKAAFLYGRDYYHVVAPASTPLLSNRDEWELVLTFVNATYASQTQGGVQLKNYYDLYGGLSGDPSMGPFVSVQASKGEKASEIRYTLLVQCLSTASKIPCPSAGYQAPQCNGNKGTCITIQQDTSEPQKGYCKCKDGWGDYACHVAVPMLQPGVVMDVGLQPGNWKHYQLKDDSVANYEILAEMTHSSVPAANVVICLKPIVFRPYADAGLPGLQDLTIYCDLSGYLLFQRYQFQMAVVRGAVLVGAQYYISVYWRDFSSVENNYFPAGWWIAGMMPTDASGTVAKVKVQALLRPLQTPSNNFVCPAGCKARGRCTEMNYQSHIMATTQQYDCACFPGYGGAFCEARVYEMNITGDGVAQSPTVFLAPGQWALFELYIDPSKFYKTEPTLVVSAVLDRGSQQAVGVATPAATHYTGLIRADPPGINYRDYPFPIGYACCQSTFVGVVGMNDAVPIPYDSYPLSWRALGSLDSAGGLPTSEIISVVAVFNNDFYTKDNLTFALEVISDKTTKPISMKTMLSLPLKIVIGVSTLILVTIAITAASTRRFVMMLLCPSAVRRANNRQAQVEMRVAGDARTSTGVPSDVIASFPQYKFNKKKLLHALDGDMSVSEAKRRGSLVLGTVPQEAALEEDGSFTVDGQQQKGDGDGQKLASAVNEGPGGADGAAAEEEDVEADDVDTCLICLETFSEGEVLRRLPCCHQFHCSCIDEWMATHTTCPICRHWLMLQSISQQRTPQPSVIIRPPAAPTPSVTQPSPSSPRLSSVSPRSPWSVVHAEQSATHVPSRLRQCLRAPPQEVPDTPSEDASTPTSIRTRSVFDTEDVNFSWLEYSQDAESGTQRSQPEQHPHPPSRLQFQTPQPPPEAEAESPEASAQLPLENTVSENTASQNIAPDQARTDAQSTHTNAI